MNERTDEGGSLAALLVRTVAALAGAAAINAGRRVAVAAAGYLVVAGLFVASLCFLTAAGYRAIASVSGDIHAALIVGCIYLGVGLSLALLLAVRRP